MFVAIPASRGSSANLETLNITGKWASLMVNPDSDSHFHGSTVGSGEAILTFLGGVSTSTGSLPLTDVAHHHLAIGVLFVWSGHLYSSFSKALGHRISDILRPSGVIGLSFMVTRSMHLQLTLALAALGVLTNIVAYVIYAFPPYAYLSYDYITSISLFIHHTWIASLLTMGGFSHASIFIIRDYYHLCSQQYDVVYRIITHKSAIISHLCWVCLFLGFHTLGIYVHNDVVVAFGQPYKQLLIEPSIGVSASSLYSVASSFSSLYGVDQPVSASANTLLGPGDFLVYHSVSLGLHVTCLILIKGSLDSKGSSLIPDKAQLGFGFSCDGPSRGGTCDVSTWDSFYLSFFWMLNTNAWLMFYVHWKNLLLWQGASTKFEDSSTFLNGWFRDYLWFNSASLIRGYDTLGSNDISVWAWAFLGAHLCWATGFMFLISWRGYWQELVDSIVFMHLKTPFLFNIWSGNRITPQALSIVQARFIGLVHFSVGFIVTYAAFILKAFS